MQFPETQQKKTNLLNRNLFAERRLWWNESVPSRRAIYLYREQTLTYKQIQGDRPISADGETRQAWLPLGKDCFSVSTKFSLLSVKLHFIPCIRSEDFLFI